MLFFVQPEKEGGGALLGFIASQEDRPRVSPYLKTTFLPFTMNRPFVGCVTRRPCRS